MIWERTLPPRHLWPNIVVNPDRPGHGGRRQDYGQNIVPVAFRVNRESRAVAMRFYHNWEQYLSSGAPYVNFEIDEICILLDEYYNRNSRGLEIIGCDEALLRVPKADLQKIRYLTVYFTACERCIPRAAERFYKWYSDWTRPNVDAFKSLEEMTIEMDWKGVQRIQVEFYEKFYRDIVSLELVGMVGWCHLPRSNIAFNNIVNLLSDIQIPQPRISLANSLIFSRTCT
jgi:hypothetical protein